jgi:DNA-binding MarR family transcriptional regulator
MIIYTGKLLLKSINSDFATLHSEITFEQMGVLYYISRNSDKQMIQQDIADMMNKTKSAVLRSIDILEEKGFLIRVGMPNDRRKNVIQLTEKGCKIIAEMHEMFLNLDNDLNNQLSIEEQKVCADVLTKIQNKCT